MRIGDGLVGIFLALLGLSVALVISTFPTQAGFFGPSLFPGIVAGGLIICGTMLLGRAARARLAGGFSVRFEELFDRKKAAQAAFLMLSSIVAYAFLADYIGFQVISFVTLVVFGFWLRKGFIFSFSTALILTVVFDLLFRVLLRVPLPPGLLEGLI